MRTEDGDIIQQCLDGKSAMFGFLVDKYKRGVYALAYSEIRNFHDAQDITQEVFIKAFQNLHTLRRWDNFMGWLSRITLNTCKNWIRSDSKRPDSEFIEDQGQSKLSNSSMESFHANQIYESVREALDSLPEMYRQILTLRYYGGMSVKEISHFLGISTSTINRRISEAQTRLKEEIITMMGSMREKQELPSSFTFRIVEIVKSIRIHPLPTTKLMPWGLTFTAGIIIAIIGFNSNFSFFDSSEAMTSLSGQCSVLDVGEFPVDVMKVSKVSVMANSDGNGSGNIEPSLQNALFMAPQAEGGTWTRKADMPTARYNSGACVVNGKIYVMGGLIPANDGTRLSTVEVYDPETDKWIKKADMPAPKCGFSASAINEKIYVFGGLIDGRAISTVEEYDPVTDKWIKKSDMPIARFFLSTCALNGKIYIIGGHNENMRIPEFYEYDPVADKWSKKANMLAPRMMMDACVIDGKIYVIGGIDLNMPQNMLADVEEYDPVTDKWSKKANMPTARMTLSVSAVNGKIYAMGGDGKGGVGIPIPIVEEYDPKTDTWAKMPNMTSARSTFPSCVVNGKIYTIGGYDGNKALSLVEEYDPKGESKGIDFKGKLPATWGDVKIAEYK